MLAIYRSTRPIWIALSALLALTVAAQNRKRPKNKSAPTVPPHPGRIHYQNLRHLLCLIQNEGSSGEEILGMSELSAEKLHPLLRWSVEMGLISVLGETKDHHWRKAYFYSGSRPSAYPEIFLRVNDYLRKNRAAPLERSHLNDLLCCLDKISKSKNCDPNLLRSQLAWPSPRLHRCLDELQKLGMIESNSIGCIPEQIKTVFIPENLNSWTKSVIRLAVPDEF